MGSHTQLQRGQILSEARVRLSGLNGPSKGNTGKEPALESDRSYPKPLSALQSLHLQANHCLLSRLRGAVDIDLEALSP